MSMGGGSSGVRPIRRSERASYSPPPVSTRSADSEASEPEEQVQPADYSLPTYVGVGGGLSNRRIVTKLPQDLQGEAPGDCSLVKIVKYVISPDVASSDVDQTVVEDVRGRIELPDCRLLINNPAGLGTPYNLGKEHLEDKLGLYLVRKEQRTGSGTVEVNFCDIAIVTHDEGGLYRGIAQLVR